MPRRGDHIHRRKDGRWEGRYKKSVSSTGKIKYGSVYGRTFLEAKQKLYQALVDSDLSASKGTPGVPFRTALDQWLDARQISHKKATIFKYQDLIEVHIAPVLGEYPVTEITAALINSFLKQKLESGRADGSGLSSTYVRSMALIITSALRLASESGLCEPLRQPISRPPVPRSELKILSKTQQMQLEHHLEDDDRLTGVGIMLSLYAGLRIGEVCALTWDDIDLRELVIHVRHTVARIKADPADKEKKTTLVIDAPKTSASLRDVPIISRLRTVLEQASKVGSAGYVLTGSNSFISPRTFSYRFQSILRASGIPHVNFHVLRHTFATRCIEAGMDVKSLSEILGHANVSVTLNTYVHSSMDSKRSQLERICEPRP